MPTWPSHPLLVVYWITYVGIGDPLQKVYVPLLDVLNYRRPDGTPQVSAVILSSATFTGTPDDFTPPYLKIDEGVMAELMPRPGQTMSNVELLQNEGIRVLLGVVCAKQMGWDNISDAQNQDFANWVKTEVLDRYGLDGIDIDDEFCDVPYNPQGLVDTIGTLRLAAPDALITKALWADSNYFTVPVSSGPNAGVYLGQLLDIGSSMDYGDGAAGLEQFIQGYTNIQVGGQDVGMSPDQLCIGVQAGVGNWMTTLADTEAVSAWVVQNGYLGVMLYTFSQDIQQWTHQPQNSPGYMFPNAGDHEWQQAIIASMT
jgi:hypothetical protein